MHDAGDFAGALAAYDAALANAPQLAALHYSRGNSLAMLRRFDEAIDAYDGCLARDPGHFPALYNRAMACLCSWGVMVTCLTASGCGRQEVSDNGGRLEHRPYVLQAHGPHDEALLSIEQAL